MEPNPYEAPKVADGNLRASPASPYPWRRLCVYGLGIATVGSGLYLVAALLSPPITTDPVLIIAICLSLVAFFAGIGCVVVGAAGFAISWLVEFQKGSHDENRPVFDQTSDYEST
jgi:uncharacterized membrane protein YccC